MVTVLLWIGMLCETVELFSRDNLLSLSCFALTDWSPSKQTYDWCHRYVKVTCKPYDANADISSLFQFQNMSYDIINTILLQRCSNRANAAEVKYTQLKIIGYMRKRCALHTFTSKASLGAWIHFSYLFTTHFFPFCWLCGACSRSPQLFRNGIATWLGCWLKVLTWECQRPAPLAADVDSAIPSRLVTHTLFCDAAAVWRSTDVLFTQTKIKPNQND